MTDQKLATSKLLKGEYSCVAVRDGNITMASYDRGIKPVFSKLMEDVNSLKDNSLADKVVGKALALLCVFAGVKSVYGYIISDCAKTILGDKGIDAEYDKIVPYIMNKDGADKCTMEKLVDNIDDPKEAFITIRDFFKNKSI